MPQLLEEWGGILQENVKNSMKNRLQSIFYIIIVRAKGGIRSIGLMKKILFYVFSKIPSFS